MPRALLIDRAAAFADKSGREFVVYRNLEEPYVSTAEVERLREALLDIETADGGVCESGYSAGYVARAALRGGGE